jgi:hypothetical protein
MYQIHFDYAIGRQLQAQNDCVPRAVMLMVADRHDLKC